MTENRKNQKPPFSLITAVAIILAAGAGLWLVLTLLEWRAVEGRIETLTEDKKQAEVFLRAHPALLTLPQGEEPEKKPGDSIEFLQDFMNTCASAAKVAWTIPPRHGLGREGKQWEASASCKVNGDVLVSLIHRLDSQRTDTAIFKLTARRSGAYADKAGPATWKCTLWIKAPAREPDTTETDTKEAP